MSAPDVPDDLTLAVLPMPVKTAAGTTIAASGFGLLHVAQIYMTVRALRAPFDLVPPAIGAIALAGVVAGMGIARARRWAPWPALGAMGALLVTSAFWFMFALWNGLFTLFGALVPILAFLAIPFVLSGRKACVATSDARKRLEEQGLELGV
jgi:hypothetical protein